MYVCTLHTAILCVGLLTESKNQRKKKRFQGKWRNILNVLKMINLLFEREREGGGECSIFSVCEILCKNKNAIEIMVFVHIKSYSIGVQIYHIQCSLMQIQVQTINTSIAYTLNKICQKEIVMFRHILQLYHYCFLLIMSNIFALTL